MPDRQIKVPGPDHPITIETYQGRITVKVAGRTIAETGDAQTLRESSYPPVHYIPRKDVDMAALERTAHKTYCPYKGECSYYSITAGVSRSTNAIWTYESPFPAVAGIDGHMAFYPDRVDGIEVSPA